MQGRGLWFPTRRHCITFQALDDCCVQAVLEEAEVAEDGGAALHSRYRSGMVKSVRQMREVAKQAAAPPEITDAEILAGAKLVARVYLVCLQELLRVRMPGLRAHGVGGTCMLPGLLCRGRWACELCVLCLAREARGAAQAKVLLGIRLLQAQVEVLVKSFGLPPELRSIARHLWLSYLPHTALLDFDPRTM